MRHEDLYYYINQNGTLILNVVMQCLITLYFIILRLNISVLNELLLVIVQYHFVYLYL